MSKKFIYITSFSLIFLILIAKFLVKRSHNLTSTQALLPVSSKYRYDEILKKKEINLIWSKKLIFYIANNFLKPISCCDLFSIQNEICNQDIGYFTSIMYIFFQIWLKIAFVSSGFLL